MRNLLAGLGGGSGAIAAGAIFVALLVAGYWVQSARSPDVGDAPVAASQPAPAVTSPAENVESDTLSEAPQTPQADAGEGVEEDTADTSEPAADTTVETVAEAAPPVEAEETTAPIPAPAFDEVRREADGVTVIAGRGAPGANISVLQNGSEIARVTADGTGKFATIALIPPDGRGHVLSLLQRGDGGEIASEGEIILAPLAAPVDVAEALPPAAPEAAEAPTAEAVADEAETGTTRTDQVIVAEADTAVKEPETTAVETAENQTTNTEAPADRETEQTIAQAPAEDVDQPLETVDTRTDAVPSESDVETAAEATTARANVVPQAKPEETEVAKETVETAEAVTADPQPVDPAPTPTPAEPASSAAAEAPKAETAVAVLKSTSEGVELLNAPAPEVMDNVAIDTISYSEGGEVQLSGRAQSEASSVRVYLNNAPVVSLDVDETGRWRGDLPDVDEGIYTLRVDEVAADGAVTSRVETPFKREDPAVLAAATTGPDGPIKAVTVQEGATLWAIARDRYGDGLLYVRVFEANRDAIRDPDLIYPGQIFALPE